MIWICHELHQRYFMQTDMRLSFKIVFSRLLWFSFHYIASMHDIFRVVDMQFTCQGWLHLEKNMESPFRIGSKSHSFDFFSSQNRLNLYRNNYKFKRKNRSPYSLNAACTVYTLRLTALNCTSNGVGAIFGACK